MFFERLVTLSTEKPETEETPPKALIVPEVMLPANVTKDIKLISWATSSSKRDAIHKIMKIFTKGEFPKRTDMNLTKLKKILKDDYKKNKI